MVNGVVAVVPPGVVTLTVLAPGVAAVVIVHCWVIVVPSVDTVTAPCVMPVDVPEMLTVAPATKFVPVSFTMNEPVPLVRDVGLSGVVAVFAANVGAAVAAVTLKFVDELVALVPPAVVTVTACAPTVALALILKSAVSDRPFAAGVTLETVIWLAPATATVGEKLRPVPVIVTWTV